MLSSSTYTTGTGSRYIVGEVRNDNAHNVEFVKITARFLDAVGNLLGSEFGYTRLDILTPGQRSPFAITSLDPPDRYDRYTLEVEASATQRQPVAGLTILSPVDQPLGPSGARSISGQVRNDSGGAVEALQIVATVYDQSGTVVATDVVNAQRPQLAAGAMSQFTIIVLHWDGGVRYELQAQARRP
ncbi:MAG TPA: FxLYD domain-containing protein [Herpetosiphonaceae bacterium]|nr:FxLYD domain-containing protein [Herpetosiphonaceae bacterium]